MRAGPQCVRPSLLRESLARVSAAGVGRCLELLLALTLALAVPASVLAQEEELSRQRAELQAMSERIEALRGELEATETDRAAQARAVAEVEREVSSAQRALRETAAERVRLGREADQIERAAQGLEARIAAGQTQLAQWLREAYLHHRLGVDAFGGHVAEADLLRREAYYLERIGRARMALLEELRADLLEHEGLATHLAAQRERLLELERQRESEQARLHSVLQTRQIRLAELGSQLRARQEEVKTLSRDEARLGELVDGLQRIVRERAAERQRLEQVRQEQARQQAASAAREAAPPRASASEPRQPARATAEVPESAAAVPRPTPTGVRFSQLRGKLGYPVRGELIGRFGASRAEGGTRWRGVFIRAGGGQEVRAVADGEVVFSDWLRGFGNLLILDHGEDFLSIYGNNDALLRVVGEVVAGGDAVASVGASGSEGESGLYFEIRHQGRPVDPLQWVSRR